MYREMWLLVDEILHVYKTFHYNDIFLLYILLHVSCAYFYLGKSMDFSCERIFCVQTGIYKLYELYELNELCQRIYQMLYIKLTRLNGSMIHNRRPHFSCVIVSSMGRMYEYILLYVTFNVYRIHLKGRILVLAIRWAQIFAVSSGIKCIEIWLLLRRHRTYAFVDIFSTQKKKKYIEKKTLNW